MASGPDGSASQFPDPFPSFVLQIQYPDFLDPPQPPCLDDATRGQVAQALRDLLSGTFPDAFVDVLCVGDNSLIHDLLGIGSLFTGSPVLAGLGLYQA